MKKRIFSYVIMAALILALLWPFSAVSHAEENWRDITQYVNVSSTARGLTSRWENYRLNIYYESSNRWGMTIGRVVVDDYSREGYFVIFLGGWRTATGIETHVAAVRDMGSEIFIELAGRITGPGGQAMTPWNLFIEIPVAFSDRFRAVSQSLGAGVDWCGDSRVVTITSATNSAPTTAITLLADISGNFETQLFAAMPTDENYMISPFSLRMALAMAANGASGESRAEILAALGIDDLNAFNQAAAAFIESSNENEMVEFNIANSIWFNEDLFGCEVLDFSETYRRIIADYFAGVAQRVNAEDGADIINAWISEQTRDRINNVIDEDAFDEDSETLAVLVNAIYFKGDWASPFGPERTRDGVFTERNGIEATILFMEQTRWFSFYENNYFRMLAKPYEDENIRMYLVLPSVDARLPFDMFEEAINQMHRREVRLRLPRFTTEFLHENLVEILQDMGIHRAFQESHFDFIGYTNMFYPPYVFGFPLSAWIGNVLQKTFIEVDEVGTEAAAVTVIYMDATKISIPSPPTPFYLDRPFIYFIRNDATGDILFMGEFAFVE